MKQERRKVGLSLVAVTLGLGAASIMWAAEGPEETVSFSANVDSAIKDIEKVLGDSGTNEQAAAAVSESEAGSVISAADASELAVEVSDQDVVAAEDADVVAPAEEAVEIVAPVEEAVEVVASEEESSPEALLAQVDTDDAAVVVEGVDVPVVADEADQEVLSTEEMVTAAVEQIDAELTETPAEEAVVEEASEEFSGFEPVAQVLEADAEEAPAAEVVEEPAVAGAETDVVGLESAVEITPSDRITVQLDKAGLEEAINLFSQLSGVNIIIPKLDREGTVTVNLNDVEWKPALQSVLDAYNLELYQKVPSVEIYTIRDKPADAPEPLELKTFKLKYATVDEVEELVKSVLGKEGGNVSKFPSRNIISVRSTAAALEEINQLVTKVDIPRQQVFIEAKFLELDDSAQESLGIDWAVLQGYEVSAGSLVQAYGKTKTKATGLVDPATGQTPETYETSFISPEGEWLDGNANQDLITKVTTSVLSADDFRMVLSALKDDQGVSVVSNPKIIVANEETAAIHIGQKKPNIKGTVTVAGQSGTVTTTYALDADEPYFTDGIMVNVTPTVNTEDNISVKIEPTLDRLDEIPTVSPDGTLFYGKTTKSINTVFSLQSGQTAAIGGLTEVTKSEVERKVPLLGSIPLVGRLFRYNSNSENQTETIIFVTLGLANPNNMSFEAGLPQDAELTRRRIIRQRYDEDVRKMELDLYDADQREAQARKLKQLEQTRMAMEKMQAAKVVEQPAEEVVEPEQAESVEQAEEANVPVEAANA